MKQISNLMFIVSMICLVGFFGGCATILSGKTQEVNVTTETGKKYTAIIDGQKTTVPSIIELTRENKNKVLTLEECPDQKVLLHKEINPDAFVTNQAASFISNR